MVPKPLRMGRQSDLPSDEVPKEVEEWSTQDVYNWMRSNGFSDYADNFSKVHKIDGQTLLMLSEKDLKEPPLQITCLGDIKRISKALYNLQKTFYGRYPESHVYESNEDPAAVCLEYNRRRKFSISGESVILNTRESAVLVDEDSEQFPADIQTVKLISRDELIRHIESPDTKLKSYTKLGISFGYCLASLLITSFVMVLVHDRVPDMKTYPPLPDIVLDNLPLIPWAFEMCEIIGVVLSTICFCIILFHKHRVIILRRMFSLVGTVFLLRCVTMMITSLSVPGGHLECRAKSYGSLKEKIVQAFHIWSKLGMSIQGVRSCGDYMFSGHTTAITMLNHFITEYTPYSWSGLHTCTWCLNLFGIFFILAGHEHYSIDVFIAFYISSRMFLYYHAYAYNHANLTATDDRMRLWFPLIWFFEGGSIGKVNNEFEMPFSIWIPRRPSFFSQGNAMKVNSKSSIQDLKKDTSTKNVTAHKKKKN